MNKYIPVSLFAVVLILAIGILSFIVVPNGDNLISGMVATQVYVLYTEPEGCSVNLSSGINMVSFYCIPSDLTIQTSLINRSNHSLNYYAVYKYNPVSPVNDAWDSYNPDLPNWAVQSLTSISRRHGYVVVMNSDGEFFREGYRFTSTDIILYEGWNFIGYPSDLEREVNQALQQINASYTRVEAYTPVNTTKTWLLHIPGSNGTLEFMTPMVGYWINMTEKRTIYVDW